MESGSAKFHVDIPNVVRARACCAYRVRMARGPTVFSSDRSDRLASPSVKNKFKELPLPSSSFHCITSATALCCLKTNISLSPYAFFQVTNPRNVLFCNVAQLVTRATVSAVMCPTWRDITQAVGLQ
jgi:hypothetical protein